MNSIRNIAIIAHVDHGKTTLVDRIIQACHVESLKKNIDDVFKLPKEVGGSIEKFKKKYLNKETFIEKLRRNNKKNNNTPKKKNNYKIRRENFINFEQPKTIVNKKRENFLNILHSKIDNRKY